MATDKNQLYLDTETKINLNKIIEQDLARNGMSSEDVAIQSQTGLLIAGFNTIFDNVSNIMNNIKRESSLTTAMYSSSLYTQLVQHETDITLSQPSRLKMFIKIPVDQIRLKGKLIQNNTYELQFTNKNVVEIDGQEFIPVVSTHYIRYTPSSTAYDLRVFHKEGEDYMSVNVPTQSILYGGIRYLVFSADFVQLTVETQERTFSDAQLDTFIVTSKYPIYDFRLYYKDNQVAEEIELTKRLFYTRGQGSFIQYKILANNSVRIDHKYVIGGFKPVVGGILRIELQTTTGEDVKYRGLAISKKVNPIDLPIEYLPIKDDIFESTGGRIANNDKEVLRNYIIKLKGSRRRIDTEADMGVWLKGYSGSSEFKPRVVVNDVKSRIFNVYTVLSFTDKSGISEKLFTVPTNSGTFNVDIKRLPFGTVGGIKWYCINPSIAIKSAQSDTGSTFGYDNSVNTDTFVPPVSETLYYYVSPFIYSYSERENFCRSFMDAQYDVPYQSEVLSESEDPRITTRFINTTLRMNDYLDETTKKRVFRVIAQIRADNPDFVIGDNTFKAVLRFQKPDETWLEIPTTGIEVVNQEENKYNLLFDLKTDRIIADTFFNLDVGGTVTQISVKPKTELDLYVKVPKETTTEEIKAITYSAPLKIFEECTSTLYMQTNLNILTGGIDFMWMPLVSLSFYQRPQNRRKIIDEVNNIRRFLNEDIFTEYDMYSKEGVTLQDVQETLFTTSIKFAKTYGRSKFLNVGAEKDTPIINLQLKPTIYIRKLDTEFDESTISSAINQTFITHDYDMIDLHMSDLVKEVLTEASESVSILQFVNFDSYPANYHMIIRNDVTEKNEDPPEVVSLEPIYDEDAGTYKYNINYITI